MIDNENLKIGLISVLHTIITNYEPEENSKIDSLFMNIMDFVIEEFELTKEEVKNLVDNVQVEVIKEPVLLN